jgi:2-succinyl-6-hydroxy-2,4-cyclohexadiene-1-carboxylate synthase
MPFIRSNGVNFSYQESGTGDPLFLLHGFTGRAESWRPIMERLNGSFRTIAIDLIGHGETDAPVDASRYAFSSALDDLAQLAATLGIENAAWLGYSMGGRLALGLALRQPSLVSSLILESASPGCADSVARRRRQIQDDALATDIEQRGVAAFVADWERLPLWQSQSRLSAEIIEAQRTIRLGNRVSGLAGSLRGMGSGAQDSLWNTLPSLQPPTLVVAGALDSKFTEIASRVRSNIPQATLHIAPDAGHAVHLERPELFTEVVRHFLSPTEAALGSAC